MAHRVHSSLMPKRVVAAKRLKNKWTVTFGGTEIVNLQCEKGVSGRILPRKKRKEGESGEGGIMLATLRKRDWLSGPSCAKLGLPQEEEKKSTKRSASERRRGGEVWRNGLEF